MSSITQIGEGRNVISLLLAVVLFGLVVAVVIASAYTPDAPPFDSLVIGP